MKPGFLTGGNHVAHLLFTIMSVAPFYTPLKHSVLAIKFWGTKMDFDNFLMDFGSGNHCIGFGGFRRMRWSLTVVALYPKPPGKVSKSYIAEFITLDGHTLLTL